MADLTVKIGQVIQTHDGREGTVRYIGPLHIATGEWLGLELGDASGKNDGSVKGERFFSCAPGFGIFVRKESAARIVTQAPQVVKSNGPVTSNGSAPPRPSVGGAAADLGRKRQSLMGPASGSAAASRLSSPTKSPAKQAPSSAGSAASTPRTGTPATTTRVSDSSTKSRLSMAGKSLMGPPAPVSKVGAQSARLSMGGAAIKSTTSRASSVASRQSSTGVQPGSPDIRSERPPSGLEEHRSPTIPEEPSAATSGPGTKHAILPPPSVALTTEPTPESAPSQPIRSRNNSTVAADDAAKHVQVIRALETKIRMLQKQRQDDQGQLQSMQELRQQNTRYEAIIQTLQKKIKANQQDLADLKTKYEEAEKRAARTPDYSGEHESELELANLDKDMAEERADMFEAELSALKLKHDELELEAEILREENRELGSIMTPEERASAGWLQMERETERLRQALVMLRDMSQQNESDLRSEIKELQDTLDELEQSASKHEAAAAKLTQAEERNRHLMEQLEAAEANDDMLDAMAQERDQNRSTIDALKRQVQDLEEHIQVTDELEAFHVEEEKRLHQQLDENDAMLSERQRQGMEQEKTIDDLEYTLARFRDVVQGLQHDIDELHRSRDISAIEAHEMSSKSRAMADLNLRLQISAAKSQLKAIDLEMGKMRADQASLHLDIVQQFVPDTFDGDKKPILALLCFARIRTKAHLTKTVLSDRLRDRPDYRQDNIISVFAVMETMTLIASLCDRFVRHLSCCSPTDFAKCGDALLELEPLDHTVTAWVEALRRDELAHETPVHLHRMGEVLADMADKLLPENRETKANELLSSVLLLENFADSISVQGQVLTKVVDANMGPGKADDEDRPLFEKKLEQVGVLARTIKHVSSKLAQGLDDLQMRSMCVAEPTWDGFQDAVTLARNLSALHCRAGEAALQELHQMERADVLTYSDLMNAMSTVAQQQADALDSASTGFFEHMTHCLGDLRGLVDRLQAKAIDPSSAVEFERLPAPWAVRAKEAKAQTVLSHTLQEELTRLTRVLQEQTAKVGARDQQLEEQQVKIELMESRAKEKKARDDGVKELKDEVERLRAENATASANLKKLEDEYRELSQRPQVQHAEVDDSKRTSLPHGQGLLADGADQTASRRIYAEMDLLKMEIASLQAAVRFLKAENRQLRVPVGETGQRVADHGWLDPRQLKPVAPDDQTQELRSRSRDVYAGLMDMARSSRPIVLKPRAAVAADKGPGVSSWRPESTTTLYELLRRKEDLARWNDTKADVIQRASISLRLSQRRKPPGQSTVGGRGSVNADLIRASTPKPRLQDFSLASEYGMGVDGVHVVRSP